MKELKLHQFLLKISLKTPSQVFFKNSEYILGLSTSILISVLISFSCAKDALGHQQKQ